MIDTQHLVVDAHEDLAWNIQTFGRDYTRSAYVTRRQEIGSDISKHNGNTLLGKTEWLIGRVGVIFSTLFTSPERRKVGPWDTQSYRDSNEAHQLAASQLEAYHRMVDNDDTFRVIDSRLALDDVLGTWKPDKSLSERRIGLVPLMEGADPIRDPAELAEWYTRGLRIIGLAWESTRYAGGTHEPGGVTAMGIKLLAAMEETGLILDMSHLAEQSFWDSMDRFGGRLIVSHANTRRFTPTTRGLTPEMVEAIAERDGVIGVVPFNVFLKPGWTKRDPRSEVPFSMIADAIDDICQIAGSAQHVGIGTDFDGGFGLEHVPDGIDTIADLQKLPALLFERGYSERDVHGIMGENWIRVLREALPETHDLETGGFR